MIDLHNHILPRVDDGARSIDESLEMARQAVQQGTTVMAATPHRFHGGREHRGPFIEEATGNLQRHLEKHEIPLKLVPGVELGMRSDTVEMLECGSAIPIGGPGGKYVLIEPPFNHIPPTALTLLESIFELGLIPLLAHPERNSEIINSLAFLDTCASLGIPLQLTSSSIIGRFGPLPMACAKEICEHRDWSIIISSDAHDAEMRTPGDMREAVATVAEWIGDPVAAERMVDDLPRSMLPT